MTALYSTITFIICLSLMSIIVIKKRKKKKKTNLPSDARSYPLSGKQTMYYSFSPTTLEKLLHARETPW